MALPCPRGIPMGPSQPWDPPLLSLGVPQGPPGAWRVLMGVCSLHPLGGPGHGQGAAATGGPSAGRGRFQGSDTGRGQRGPAGDTAGTRYVSLRGAWRGWKVGGHRGVGHWKDAGRVPLGGPMR